MTAHQIHIGAANPDSDRNTLWFIAGACFLVAAIFLAYLPAIHGTAVWDDDYMLTANPVMTDLHGLQRIWFDLSAVKVYYPLTLTALWAEYRLFGIHSLTGYHIVNTLLHAINSIILWRLLRSLNVAGAFAIAAIWGLHPVGVESVAWITEHKNTLSGLLYLTSMSALLRYFAVIGKVAPTIAQRRWWYAAAMITFVLALSAKTTAVTLPAAALLLMWWKTGQLRARHLWVMIPFAALAMMAGALTQYVEVHTTGAWHDEWSLTLPEALLVAGRAIWFYAGKLLWPAGLMFTYPRWQIDADAASQWLYPMAAAAVVVALWIARRWMGRGPVTGLLFFVGTLVPALGFFHVQFQRYSFVADHFQYMAGVGLIAVGVGWVASLGVPRIAKITAFVLMISALIAITFQSSKRFVSDEAVWAAVLSIDPDSPIANLNYAANLVAKKQYDRSIPFLVRAEPSTLMLGRVWENLGIVAEMKHDPGDALECYRKSVETEPENPDGHYRYGRMLLIVDRLTEAAEQLRIATIMQPDSAEAHDNLGVCLQRLGQPAAAVKEFRIALQIKPDEPLVRKHLAEVGQ